MPLLCFHPGAYKAVRQYKCIDVKLPDDADMTAHDEHFIMVLDGLSGVLPPMQPSDFSWDLRNALKYNLQRRFSINTDRDSYDIKLKEL